ncbi:hypothetical protein Ct61P_10129 [Colletotrichum tofieldiae]|nr:hypothetical protein Ct61P_10129 [Colletotrichum tofieldiae]
MLNSPLPWVAARSWELKPNMELRLQSQMRVKSSVPTSVSWMVALRLFMSMMMLPWNSLGAVMGLEDLAAGLVEGLAEGHLRGQVEGEIGGIRDVGGTIVDDHLGADDLVAQERALVGGLLEALGAGGDVLVGDGAADDLGLEGVLLRVLKGLDPAGDAGVVTGTATLSAEEEVVVGLAGDGLAALDVDLEVELAHARDDGLLGLLVDVQAEGGVLSLEAVHGLGKVVGVAGALGLDGQRHDGVGDEHGGHCVWQVAVGEGVSGGAVDAEDGADLAGADLVDVLHLVGVHAHDAGDADLLVGAGVEEVGALAELALVDADVGELAVVVLLELEGEADEGERIVGHQLDGGLVALLVEGLVLDLGRVREVIADGVEHGLDALVGEGGTHHDGGELESDGGTADGGLDLGVGRDLLVEEQLGHLVVDVGELLDEFLTLLLDEVLVAAGEDVSDLDDGTAGTFKVVGLLLNQVNDALELVLGSDGDLDGGGGDLELLVDLFDGLPGVGTHAVHLVHETDAGDVVALHLTVDGDGLTLDAGDGAQDHDGAVEDTQSSLDLDGEVDVAGSIDDVDVVGFLFSVFRLLPVSERGGRLDGDALFSLEIHGVHLGADRVLAADLVDRLDAARVEQNSLRGRRLSAVNVGRDTDVAHTRQAVRLLGLILAATSSGVRAEALSWANFRASAAASADLTMVVVVKARLAVCPIFHAAGVVIEGVVEGFTLAAKLKCRTSRFWGFAPVKSPPFGTLTALGALIVTNVSRTGNEKQGK